MTDGLGIFFFKEVCHCPDEFEETRISSVHVKIVRVVEESPYPFNDIRRAGF